jgi:hypothetical protein
MSGKAKMTTIEDSSSAHPQDGGGKNKTIGVNSSQTEKETHQVNLANQIPPEKVSRKEKQKTETSRSQDVQTKLTSENKGKGTSHELQKTSHQNEELNETQEQNSQPQIRKMVDKSESQTEQNLDQQLSSSLQSAPQKGGKEDKSATTCPENTIPSSDSVKEEEKKERDRTLKSSPFSSMREWAKNLPSTFEQNISEEERKRREVALNFTRSFVSEDRCMKIYQSVDYLTEHLALISSFQRKPKKGKGRLEIDNLPESTPDEEKTFWWKLSKIQESTKILELGTLTPHLVVLIFAVAHNLLDLEKATQTLTKALKLGGELLDQACNSGGDAVAIRGVKNLTFRYWEQIQNQNPAKKKLKPPPRTYNGSLKSGLVGSSLVERGRTNPDRTIPYLQRHKFWKILGATREELNLDTILHPLVGLTPQLYETVERDWYQKFGLPTRCDEKIQQGGEKKWKWEWSGGVMPLPKPKRRGQTADLGPKANPRQKEVKKKTNI